MRVWRRNCPSAGMDPVQKRDDDERWESSRRRHHFHTGATIVLAVLIVGLAWYAYPMLKRQDASVADLRQQIRDRLKQLEDRTADTSSSQQSLRDQADKLSKDLRARLDAAGRRASQAAQDAYGKLQGRLDTETHKLDAEIKARYDGVTDLSGRVSSLESSHAADQTQIAQLKQELNQVREQADRRASQEATRLEQKLEETQTDASEQLADLRRAQDRDRRSAAAVSNNVANISGKLAVDRITFEASKNHNSELADGISLYVSGTDVAYRRVSGWMWVAGEHRNIWLRGQSALEPVTFYGSQDGLKRELVITNVGKNSVTGYLLLPKQVSQPASATAGGE